MADKSDALEKGEYIIGIAVILAALLVSATVYVSFKDLQGTLLGLKLAAPAAAAVAQQQGQPAAQQNQPAQTGTASVQKISVDFSQAYFQGKSDAKIIMVEYSDFQCPYCSRVLPAVAQVKQNYPDMKFVFRQYPLPFHPNAQKAAEASLCAGAQGKFFEMHDKMFADQNKLAVSDLKASAAGIAGLDTAKFNSCLDSGETAATTAAEMAEGQALGIGGTPGFLIYGKASKSGVADKLSTLAAKLKGYGLDVYLVQVNGAGEGIVFAGALPYENFQEIMDAF